MFLIRCISTIRIRSAFTIIAAAAIAVSLAAATAKADDVAITFYGAKADGEYYDSYRDGFALVQDDRTISFKPGRMAVALPGVSSGIDPATVTFEVDDVEIVEQNFDFDLLTPGKLLEKSVGDMVEIVRVNPATGAEKREQVKILSVNQGAVIEVGGKIEVLRDDKLPTRVIYDKVPDNLRASPTLSVVVDSRKSGARNARLTYISDGLGWRGDYVAVFDEKAERLDLQGWATIKNTTSTTFENAALSLAAGEVRASSSLDDWNARRQRRNQQRNQSRAKGGNDASDQERIGDNYLYTLPFRTTVASNQTKQISIIEADNVHAKRVYEYRATGLETVKEPQNADVRIAFSNSRAGGLAAPLPAGAFRIYARDSSGRAQFIGEDEIPNSPGGSDLSVRIGEAFDISVEQAATDETRVSKNRYEVTMQYLIRNAKPEAAAVTIRQPIWRSWWNETIAEESLPHQKTSSDELFWEVAVPAEGEATLEFTLTYSRPD